MTSRLAAIALIALFMAGAAHAAGRGMLAETQDPAEPEVACPTSGVDPACDKCSAPDGYSVQCKTCSENSYLVRGVCMCNPGFGYRFSVHYCTKCPKGQLHCNDEYYLGNRGGAGASGMQSANSNWVGK
ncbi:hypothetical protein Rsub_09013 [Raphidocelis subcapitata]|uniref:Tyrosine-protein kinase ephrin type A/B receptor-like domain-containing protein n=1 Tax=Raphidocelis subcapitata TaxID=307507 RepID=A0A2V0PGA5_9CHLO|nr:hypothetical protein Rsub_09013 [Raphidocelis subcapitata]|eukprot:GBF96933.1 hypothetical protein Rsub_09013 [Raphidocelis subcapitata]